MYISGSFQRGCQSVFSDDVAPLQQARRDYGEAAGLALPAHPHMLRHAYGFALADQDADTQLIQDYLVHRNIQHTVMYTATDPAQQSCCCWMGGHFTEP